MGGPKAAEGEKVKYVVVVIQVEHDLKFFSTGHQINSKVQQETKDERLPESLK